LLVKEFPPIVNFYLVRHGDAVPENLDPRRPLSRLGREQAEHVARAAAARQAQVSAIFHSGILRAEQTAEIMARHLVPELGVRRITGLAPQDDPAIAKAELETSQAPVMFVGHLPHMSRLAGLLINGDAERDAVEFAPATVVCVSHQGSRWELIWVLGPVFL
jgi:phosphohistidine phosphatase